MGDYVYGTADELRALAATLTQGDQSTITAALSEQDQRIAAVQAHFPTTPIASLAGRVFCASPRFWSVITTDGAELYLYGMIGEWEVSAVDFIQALAAVVGPAITVRVNSPGGDYFEGMAIYNALIDHPAQVEVRVDALAASAASFIAMAGNRVVMNRQARMMIHDAHGIVAGNAADMVSMADVLDAISDDMAAIYAARAGGTPAKWRGLMKAETWYSAEKAVAAGLADEAVSSAKIPDDETAAAYAARQPAPIITTAGAHDGPAGQGLTSPAASGPGPDLDDRYTQMAAFVAANR